VEPLGAVQQELAEVLGRDLAAAAARRPAHQHRVEQLLGVLGGLAGVQAVERQVRHRQVFGVPGDLGDGVAERLLVPLEPLDRLAPVELAAAAGALEDVGGAAQRLAGADLLVKEADPQQRVAGVAGAPAVGQQQAARARALPHLQPHPAAMGEHIPSVGRAGLHLHPEPTDPVGRRPGRGRCLRR
jgi:hypothetical protein